MEPEVLELEPRLKEILYGCMETIHATKAALYLLDGDTGYALTTSYGFSDSIRKIIAPGDPLPDRLLMRRAPFFVNGLNEEPRFSEILFAAGTDRLLAAPIYSRGRLVGFLDLRDKAGKQPFTTSDITESQKLVERYLEVFAEKQIYGQQSVHIAMTAGDRSPAAEMAASNLVRTIELARTVVERQHGPGFPAPHHLTEPEMLSVALLLPSILQIEGALLAAFTSFGRLGGGQIIAAKGTVPDATLENFRAKLAGWIRKRGESDEVSRSSVQLPFGKQEGAMVPERVASVLSAPVAAAGMPGLVLSIGLEKPPSAAGRAFLEIFLKQIEQAVEQAISHHSVRQLHQRIAERLLEPDFQKYPHLVNHSRRVSSMAEHLAGFVGLPPEEVELVRLAGLVHDVGMRLLDYQTLYRKREISDAEMRMIQEHPVLSAALVADSGLPPPVAAYVLSHHERVDGKGYPKGLTREQIPPGARVLHICEAFDAMTASDSYQVPLPENEAIERVLRGAGVQFDPVYAQKFQQMLRHEVQV